MTEIDCRANEPDLAQRGNIMKQQLTLLAHRTEQAIHGCRLKAKPAQRAGLFGG